MKPWAVPLRALSRILANTQSLLDENKDDSDTKNSNENLQPKILLRLIDIKCGSAAYKISSTNSNASIKQLETIHNEILKPNDSNWNPEKLSSIEELSSLAKSLDCEIQFCEFVDGEYKNHVIAKITPNTFKNISKTAFIYGQTSLCAKIERVGGAVKKSCAIRINNQSNKMVYCDVIDEDLIRQLGRYVYENVVVSGQATWYRASGKLRHMNITDVEPPKSGSILESLDKIYKAGGDAWDSIEDPDAFIAEMRG